MVYIQRLEQQYITVGEICYACNLDMKDHDLNEIIHGRLYSEKSWFECLVFMPNIFMPKCFKWALNILPISEYDVAQTQWPTYWELSPMFQCAVWFIISDTCKWYVLWSPDCLGHRLVINELPPKVPLYKLTLNSLSMGNHCQSMVTW